MELKSLLQDAVSYIEEHILDDISYEDVAKKVYMSNYNFHRIFSMVTGMTANTYIRKRRLTLAGQELQTMDISVINAAYKYCYETPESFSKAFSRFHKVTPNQAKQKGAQLLMLNPLVIKIIIEGGNVMDYRIEKKDKQRFIAKVRQFDNEAGNGVDENGCTVPDFWKECHKENSIEPIRNLRPEGKRDLYGLCSSVERDSSKYDYGIGVEINSETKTDDLDSLLENAFVLWDMEASDYVVFKAYGENGDCLSEVWSRFFKEFLPNTKYEMAEGTDYEVYYENGEEGLFCEVWIPIS